MTELVLGLIPDYGLYVVFGVVVLACLSAPLPASMLVLASGGFAAAGDLTLWQVFAAAFAAFILGDQIAYRIARLAGQRLLGRLRRQAKMAGLIARSEALLERRGTVAVLLSHTILSPTCPYVSILCGAGGMRWAPFTVSAVLGAAIWTAGYVALGYLFAGQLTQTSEILGNFFGIIIAGAVLIGSGFWLFKKWRAALAVE